MVSFPELVKETRLYFGFVTIPEIEIFFRKGYQNEYGQYFGLNNKTYLQWIRQGSQEDNRVKAIKAMEKAYKDLLPKPKELTEDEKREIIKQGAIKCFSDFKATGILTDVGNISYRFLWEKGLIKHAQEVKDKMLITVKERLRHQEAMKLQDREYIGQHTAIKHELEEISNGKSSKLISEGKRESLKIYFQNLIEMEIELKDELNES